MKKPEKILAHWVMGWLDIVVGLITVLTLGLYRPSWHLWAAKKQYSIMKYKITRRTK